MSANLVVDIGGTCDSLPSVIPSLSGQNYFAASGGLVGQSVDLLHSDTFCNLNVVGFLTNTSGQLRVAVQVSDTDTSGNYTDPTSGLAQFPTYFMSGGILIINSGGLGSGLLGPGNQSGQNAQSGFSAYAGFQRTGRFARGLVLSGDFYVGPIAVNFVSQRKTTGSGGGFSFSPGSGQINV